MGRKVDPYVEQRVKVLSNRGMTYKRVRKVMKSEGFTVSDCAIHRIRKCKGIHRRAQAFGLVTPPPKRTPVKVKKRDLEKLKKMTSEENPPSQRAMASRLAISQSHINKLIRTKLGKTIRKKTKVHVLTERHKKIEPSMLESCMRSNWPVLDPISSLPWTRHSSLSMIAAGHAQFTTRTKIGPPKTM